MNQELLINILLKTDEHPGDYNNKYTIFKYKN